MIYSRPVAISLFARRFGPLNERRRGRLSMASATGPFSHRVARRSCLQDVKGAKFERILRVAPRLLFKRRNW